jgi:molybdopterin synthase sulfur carrier subunit
VVQAPVRVVLASSFGSTLTGGVKEFSLEAKTLRDVIKALDERYPGLGEHLEEETTVAIDGDLYEVGYSQPVRPGCEVFFIPKIEGG